MMRVLILGSGGREHAIAWSISKSSLLTDLYVLPGNGGTAQIAENVDLDITNLEVIKQFILSQGIDFVIIGSENLLVKGIGDLLNDISVPYFGCTKEAAQLESSKIFTKKICDEYNISTASYKDFDSFLKAEQYIDSLDLREKRQKIVIKADGLAAGKGVLIAEGKNQAKACIKEIFQGKFGDAGKKIIIEEYLEGKEVSVFVLSDGNTFKYFASACDYKKLLDGDLGKNTGGMGAYTFTDLLTESMKKKIWEQIIDPSFQALKAKNIDFKGVLFAGIILTEEGPKLLEYNVRFGDPETQSILPNLKTDLLDLMLSCARGNLEEKKIEFFDDSVVNVVIVSKGYPGEYKKDIEVKNLYELALNNIDEIIFHAGTYEKDGKYFTNGGRVLNIVAKASDLQQAKTKCYALVEKVKFDESFYRTDIAS